MHYASDPFLNKISFDVAKALKLQYEVCEIQILPFHIPSLLIDFSSFIEQEILSERFCLHFLALQSSSPLNF